MENIRMEFSFSTGANFEETFCTLQQTNYTQGLTFDKFLKNFGLTYVTVMSLLGFTRDFN